LFEIQSSHVLSFAPPLLLALVCLGFVRRRAELQAYAGTRQERTEARTHGSYEARLQHPDIDLTKCIGCGLCVQACPEEGVLAIDHGQAVVVHGARCVGHGRCAEACPTSGIAITLGDLSDRTDLPALDEEFQAVGVPGLYLAGEISGFALVRTAVSQGTAVADAVARSATIQADCTGNDAENILDLLIVGAGPGGLSCSLRAKELGLQFHTIDQEDHMGGTVASYPRRKMVMTQPVELPLHGRLPRLTYQKEELMALWESVSKKNQINVEFQVNVTDIHRNGHNAFVIETNKGPFHARNVCLALGRRGTPRKLDIPGEALSKVAYSLLDAESYQNRRILVVGGGDSAIEAAIGLSEQPDNEVTLCYRKSAFFRLKYKNEQRIREAIESAKIRVLFESTPDEITPDSVRISTGDGTVELPNDDVFIFAGGTPPFSLLEHAGVSFDPKDRPPPSDDSANSRALLWALCAILGCSILMAGWYLRYAAYYDLSPALRPASSLHDWLRPSGPFGLAFGLLACALFLCNLSYLARRSFRIGQMIPGSLKSWMQAHVFTGLLAFLCVIIHAGFGIRNTSGGHAFLALAAVVATGSIGRYLYAFVPRAANGRELDLEAVRSRLTSLSSEWDARGRSCGAEIREQIDALVAPGRWNAGFAARLLALLSSQRRVRIALKRIRQSAKAEDIPLDEVRELSKLATRSYRLAIQIAHYEDLRALLSSWRYFHRWIALLMILFAVLHVRVALRYGQIDWNALFGFLGGAQ